MSPLIFIAILPLFAKASLFVHNTARLQQSTPRQLFNSSNLCNRNPCHIRRHFHCKYPTRATATAATTTTRTTKSLQLLYRCHQPQNHQKHKFLPWRRHHTDCEKYAYMMSSSDFDLRNAADHSSSSRSGNESQMKILGICGGIGSGKSTACRLMVSKLKCAGLIDADKLAHTVYEPGSLALNEIIDEFGTDILLENDGNDDENDGENRVIDRKKLGAIVFKDAKSMSKLERIVWPHVRTKIEEGIQEITLQHQRQQNQLLSVKNATSEDADNKQQKNTLSSTKNIIIVEAALLLETEWHDLLDGLWIIHSSEDVATSRLMNNRGMTKEEALLRIRAQQKRKGMVVADGGVGDEAGLLQAMEGFGETVTAIITNDGSLDDLEKALEKRLADPLSFKTSKMKRGGDNEGV